MLLLVFEEQTKRPSKSRGKMERSGLFPVDSVENNVASLQTAFMARFCLSIKRQAEEQAGHIPRWPCGGGGVGKGQPGAWEASLLSVCPAVRAGKRSEVHLKGTVWPRERPRAAGAGSPSAGLGPRGLSGGAAAAAALTPAEVQASGSHLARPAAQAHLDPRTGADARQPATDPLHRRVLIPSGPHGGPNPGGALERFAGSGGEQRLSAPLSPGWEPQEAAPPTPPDGPSGKEPVLLQSCWRVLGVTPDRLCLVPHTQSALTRLWAPASRVLK